MPRAAQPENEAKRLDALKEFGLLDTGADPAYEAFARLAAKICGTPMAAVSLIDADRQWLKANVGMDGYEEIPRDQAFCAHAILTEGITEVADATADVRFSDNPLVTGDPNLRFYAGVPLVDQQGHAVGMLCALDQRPRILSDRQRALLERLGDSLVSMMESRKGAEAKSLESVALVSEALEASAEPTMISTLDAYGIATVSYVNRAFTELFGFTLPDLVGKTSEILHGPKSDREAFGRLREAARTKAPRTESLYLYTVAGAPLLIEFRDRPIDALHRIVSLRDLTPFREAQDVLTTANQRLDSLVTNNSDALFTLDANGTCVDVNPKAIDHFGYAKDELVGSGVFKLAAPGLFPDGDPFPAALVAGETIEFASTYAHRDGRAFEFETKAIPMIVDGLTEGAYVIARDVTEAKRSAELLAKQAKRTRALYLISAASETADASQIDATLALVLETLNMTYGYVGLVEGKSLRIEHAIGEGPVKVGDALPLEQTYARDVLEQSDVMMFEDLSDEIHHRDGVPHSDWGGYISARLSIEGRPHGAVGFLSTESVPFDERDRDFIRLVAALVSSTLERKVQKQRLNKLAFYDTLTGLSNRAKFMRDLNAALSQARRHKRSFALHFIDLDGFKSVNDRAGHTVGDLALQEAARRLQNVARLYDVPARLGGDEFVVLQPEVATVSDTKALGERLVHALSQPYDLDGATFDLGASVGVAIYPEDGRSARELLQNADFALYRAKANGKRRVEIGMRAPLPTPASSAVR